MTVKNELVRELAPFVRPLLLEVARSFQLANLYIGIAFRYDTSAAVFFAEFVPASGEASSGKDYAGDRYVLSRSLPFTAAVLEEVNARCRFKLQAGGTEEVEGDIRSRWGKTLEEIFLFRLPLTADGIVSSSDAVLYLGSQAEAPTETCEAVRRSSVLISQVLRTALFLASGGPAGLRERGLPELTEELARKLPRLKEYESYFQSAIDDRVNPTAWFTHRFPEGEDPSVKAESGDASDVPRDIEALMKAIRNAATIVVRSEPDGSFQHKDIRIVTITPRSPDGGAQAAAYDAVVKAVDREKAQKEQAGYQLAQLFFRDIGFALPPSPILWPIPAKGDGERRRFASVIPKVSGMTFTRYTREGWHPRRRAYESTGDHFARIYRDLVAFANGLGQGPAVAQEEGELVHQCLYESHFGESSAARRRRGKTLEALRYYLGSIRSSPSLHISTHPVGVDLCNPLWVFERICFEGVRGSDGGFWADCVLRQVPRVDFCHGDFHTGNILVRDDGSVTVLDYDYVARDRQFLDIATLEASFILSLSWSSAFEDESTWLEALPPLLVGLANQEEVGPVPKEILASRDSLDAWRVVQEGRRWVGREGSFGTYRALLASALFRLLASHHALADDRRRYSPGVISTAICFLGALLRKLVNVPSVVPSQPSPVVCVYRMPCSLEQSTFDYGHQVTRDYFKWLGRRIGNRHGNRAEIDELMRYAGAKEPGDAATAYRLGLRLLRRSPELAETVASKMEELYRAEADHGAGEGSKILSAWADRYARHKDGTPRSDEKTLLNDSDVSQGLDISQEDSVADGWDVSAFSHSGRFDSEGRPIGENEDAFTIARSEASSFLAAVADGTGDSEDGARAARVALSALIQSWRSGGVLVEATVQASLAVQRDNLCSGLDGACTLAAIVVETETGAAQAVWVGDAQVVLLLEGGKTKASRVDLETRCVLGGEPLGDIITSGGNRVREVMAADAVQTLSVERLRGFILSSDGALVDSDPDSEVRALSALFDREATSAVIATAVRDRALEAVRLKKRKPDNVTVSVGRGPLASSAVP